MKKNNLIAISVISMFLVCAFFLAYVGTKNLDPANSNSWWTVYFQDPKSPNMSFDIENHSASTNFHWEVDTDNNSTLLQGTENIKNNQTKNITIPDVSNKTGKISVVVTTDKDRQEIYKNF